MSKRRLIGLTGPSSFTQCCTDLIENRLNANFVMLYHEKVENVLEWLPQVSGIILAGGVDIHPQIYGNSVMNNKSFTKFDLARDMRELSVLQGCFEQQIPTLGICRGHQILSIFKGLGSDFIMDLNGDICHQPGRNNVNVTLNKEEPSHIVSIDKQHMNIEVKIPSRSFVYEDKEKDRITTFINSFHHQGVRLHPKNPEKFYAQHNIIPLAVSPTGMQNECTHIIEAMRGDSSEDFWMSCQWHPEYDHMVSPVSAKIIDMYEEILVKYEKK